MSTDRWPEGYDRVVLKSVDSTNSEAMRIVSRLVRPTWILAHAQTKARGRRGRAWQNPPGNFAATLVMRPGGLPDWAALRSFLAANALYETLALFAPREKLALKWPNDVLLDERKVAGILLESTSCGGQIDWLAIGFGVNLLHTPTPSAEAAVPPVSLREVTGEDVYPEEFLTLLAGHYATEESILDRLGFEPIRQDWLGSAARLGEEITARTGKHETKGLFDTIDEHGRLVLITGTGPVKIAAADVYF
ncbi:MAG: biotin--[acetyl-CoA-carboxylase] ligase [Pseudomonadota bacterium]